MKKLFVGNLPTDTKEADLIELFERFGTVRSHKIIMDMFTRKCKGFGFIEMEGHEARAAIEGLNGKEFNRLNLMALRADQGNQRAIKQFDNLIKDEAKVMSMISTKKMARGGIMEFYDSYEPKDEKEREVIRYIPPYIPLTGQELSKIDFDYMFGNVNMLPSSSPTQYDDKDHQAYIRYYNDAGVNYFVTSGRRDEA